MTGSNILVRLAHVTRVLLVYGVSFLLSTKFARWTRLRRYLRVQPWGPQRLCSLFEDLGGTFIKFGQVLALQPDIIPMEYCNALFNLMDRVASFDYDSVRRTFIEDLGRTPEELFESFDCRPIATASVAQVHVAYFKGRKYAVKVQRPSVADEFSSDIQLMTAAIRTIKGLRLRKLFWVVEPLSEFVAWTHEELDFRFEARYMEQLGRNAAGSARERIPECIPQFTTRRILAVEFFETVTVLDYLRAIKSEDALTLGRLRASGFDANRFAENTVNNFLGDAFGHGMFHADLHPANLMILPNSVVGYIDFGITAVLSQYSRRHLVALTLAYSRGDLDGMCAAFFKVSDMAPDADPDGFRKSLNTLSLGWYGEPGEGPRLRKSITLMMMDLLMLSRKTGIWPERDVIKYIRSAIALDGLIKRFAPNFDVGLQLERICDQQIKWRLRRSVFSFKTLVDFGSESSELANSGIFRVSNILRQLAGGEFSARLDVGADMRRHSLMQGRAVQLGAIVLLVSLYALVTRQEPHLGFNLFTAQAGVVAFSIGAILRSIGKLT